MSSIINAENVYCHSCSGRPLDGAIEDEDGELKCLKCGKMGFIEIVDDSNNLLNNESTVITNKGIRDNSTILTDSISPNPSSLPPVPAPDSVSSNHLNQQYPFSHLLYPPSTFTPQMFTTPNYHQIHPFEGTARSPLNTGFHLSFSDHSNEARLIPGVLPPSTSDSTFLPHFHTHRPQPPLAFTTTMNNVDFGHFMNSLLEGFGQFAGVAGLDQVIQFIMEQDNNRFGSPPASAAVVAALPEETLTSETAVGDCAICQEDFKPGDKVKCLSQDPSACPHMFHCLCVTPWLNEHNSCPICRFELPTDDPDYEQRRLQRQRERATTNPQPQSESQFHVLDGLFSNTSNGNTSTTNSVESNESYNSTSGT